MTTMLQELGLSNPHRTPKDIVREMIKTHQTNRPELGIAMGIWLNPTNDLKTFWQYPVRLLEITLHGFTDPDPDFHAYYFPSMRGWPAFQIILTTLGELNLATEINHPFVVGLESDLKTSGAIVLSPRNIKNHYDAFVKLLEGN